MKYIENNTWSRGDMEFIFECSHRYRTSERSERVRYRMWIWIVTFAWKKIWSVFENFKADHAWRLMNELEEIREVFPKKWTSESSTMTTNLPWKASLPFAVFFFFFTRTNGGKMETTSRKTQCPVSKILQRYIKELKLTALLVLTK